MKKNTLFLIIASYTPYMLFGHSKNFAGWEFAFIFYSLCYFLLGLFLRKTTIRPAVYHSIIFSSLVMYAIFLYLEDASLYFPMITPATLIVGSLSYILGCTYGFQQNKKYLILMSLLLIGELIYGNYFVRSYMYHYSMDSPKDSHLYNKYIEVVQLRNLEGKLVSDKQFDNKVLILDFWYTKCGNCMFKLQELDKIYEHFAGNPNVLIASIVDGKQSSLEETRDLLKKWKFKHPIYYDSMGILINKYQIGKNGYPIELRIAKDGYIKHTYGGFTDDNIINYVKNSIAYIENLLQN